jgi:adenylate cyclase
VEGGARRLFAVVHFDMVGYSRLISQADFATVERLRHLRRELIEPNIERHAGKLVQTAGDALLIVFESATQAVRCAIAVQSAIPAHDGVGSRDQQIRFRAGIDVGEAIEDGTDLHGDGVNIAARLQEVCPPGAICISRTVHEHVMNRLDVRFESLGELALKNIDRSVEAFVWYPETVEPADRNSLDDPARARSNVASHGTLLAPKVFPRPGGGPPWIAVLPFRAAGPDPVPDYFSGGLVEDIVCNLVRVQEPVVISANSTAGYRDQPQNLRRIGRELGVRYVAAGSIRKSGNRLRIAAELTEAESGVVLWAQPYDVEATLLFDVQDNIAGRIVSTWLPRLHEAELRRIRTKRPESMTAYDFVLQARDLVFRLDRQALEQATKLLACAISLESDYSAAHALMADLVTLRVGQGWSEDIAADARTSDRMAHAAITSDPYNTRALAIYAHNRSFLYRDYDTAVRLFDRALETAPNDANAWMWSTCTQAYIGDGPGSVARAERALRLSPRDALLFRYYSSLCLAHYTNGSYEEAAHWGRLAAHESPNYTANLRFTSAALVELGHVNEARELVGLVMRVQPEFRAQHVIDRHPYRDLDRRVKIARALITAGLQE